MIPLRRLALLAGAVLGAARPARAQDSDFGIRSLGTPGRWESVRARTTGGAFAAFDPSSGLTEAALVQAGTLTATATAGSSYRRTETATSSANLRTARFPLFSVGGPLARRVFFGIGFATYLDRSFDVTTRDSSVVRGATTRYSDEFASDGGVSDLRAAGGVRLGSRLALGLVVHMLTGSTRITATRRFDDTTAYATVLDSEVVRQTGFGVSGSALVALTPALAVIGFARKDATLHAHVGNLETSQTTLPTTLGAAVQLTLSPVFRVGGSVLWRSWSNAGPNAFNTLGVSGGVEIGGARGTFRFGARAGTLPFGPGSSAPHEWGVAGGVGRTFAGGRAVVDLGLEHLIRDGGGLHERVVTALVGVTVKQ